MKWYVYRIAAIDSGWVNLKTVKETVASLAVNDDLQLAEVQEFTSGWASAQISASVRGWEGIFRHDPVVFWIPFGDMFTYGFVIKQDNNGDTFVVSPVAMPWLEKESF